MFLSNRSASNSVMTGLLLKARQFGVFSIVALTSTLVVSPLATQAQITTDGSTATEVKGNAIAPTGQGTVNGGNLYNSFDKFNVPTSGVIFNTGTSSVDGTKVNNIINRVTGNTPSNILGTIESRQAFPNANLYLLNPNGIVFGVNSRLDIGGSFYANTGTGLGFDQNQKFNVDKNSLSFPSGDPTSIQFAVAQPAAIINQGDLAVDAGKNISLTAGTIINTGNLSAPAGNVNVAAVAGNSQVELRSPDLVLGLAVTKNAVPTTWNGTISTLPKLAELLTGKVIQADQVVVKPDGSIALVATPNVSDIVVKDGMAIASGTINVSSNLAKGGNIGIFGDQVGLVNAQINASGITGGGTVLVGGNLQGKGIAPNALQTYVDASSNIVANGLLTGDGGKVIVWSDRSTQFYGAIAARGGDISGNGGFVEVSGKENLDYRGNTDTRAPYGKTGALLLDPTNITVAFSGSATLDDVSAFTNPLGSITISSNLIDTATSNVILQATNDISFSNPINVTNLGIGITAQAGNSITVNSPITTNRGNVRLIANDPASGVPTNAGNISINAPITTNGGAIELQISGAGQLTVNGDLSSGAGNINLIGNSSTFGSAGISIGSFNTQITSGSGSITLTGNSTSASGISINGLNTQIISGSGAITLNGNTSSNASNGIVIPSFGATISSTSGSINILGNSTSLTGNDAILINSVFAGNATVIQTNGDINFTGNVANLVRLGINIQSPSTGGSLNINSGTGNITFTSDQSVFPNTGISSTGNISLQPFSNNTALLIDRNSTNVSGSSTNVFLDNSFINLLANTNTFNQVIISNISRNNAISLNSNLFIGTPNFAPISIQTGNTFNGGGFAINTSQSAFNLVANQGITNLGDLITDGKDITISSSLGNIISAANTVISSSSTDISGGNISITANNGLLNLQGLDSATTSAFSNNAGNITLVSAGQISFGNIRANRGNAIGNAGTLSVTAGANSNIVITGNTVNLSAFNGSSSNLTFSRPVVIDNSVSGSSLTIDTTGTTNGSVTFNNTITSPVASALSINTNSGNVTFGNAIASSTQPLGNLTITSTGTTNFASTVFASGITSNFGNTIINADLVATGINGITLRNFTVNGNVSLVGDELDFNGIASGNGNLTLKPVTVSQPIAIAGAIETNGILDLTTTDLAAFAGGTFSSLTIGNLLGTGTITLAGNANFAQPTTIQSPVGTGSFNSNGFDITGLGRLGIEVGDSINIANSTIAPITGTLNVRLNADRDGNGGTVTITDGSLINTGGNNITIGGGLNPIVNPALSTGGNIAGVTINGSTLDAAGGNIVINGASNSTFGTNNDGITITNTAFPSNSQLTTSGAGTITLSGTSSNFGFNNRGILLDIGSIIEAVNGNITLNGTGNGVGNSNYGIIAANDSIIRTTGSGSLNLTGISNGSGLDNTGAFISRSTLSALGTGAITLDGQSGSDGVGVSLISNSTVNFGVINTNNGNISITGISRGTGSANRGVLIDGNATVIASNNGNVNITGTGGNGTTGSGNQGILITGGNAVVEASNGNLTLNGTGNGTLNFNHGIAVTNNALVRTTGTGTLNLTGVSNATGLDNDGIFIDQSTVTTTTTGNIFLTGTSGTGNSQSAGISISGNSTLGLGTISSIDGSITLSGTSRATGNNNQGVVLGGNATIAAANNTNNISITGTGGVGANNNQGILVDLATSSISIGNGALTLIGTGRGTGTGNDGIAINAGNIDSLGTGSIAFTGFAPANSFGILLSNANIKPTNTSGLLRFSADEIDSNGLSNIRGTGLLFIEPITATRNIVIGGTANPSDGNLEVSNTLRDDLLGAFSQIFIGSTNSSGLISLVGNATFTSSLTLRSPVGTGAINTSGFILQNINGTVTLLANQNITTSQIETQGRDITLTSNTGLIDTSSGIAGNEGVLVTTGINSGNITLNATGFNLGNLLTFTSGSNSGTINFLGSGNITISGSSINVANGSGNVPTLNFPFPVILNSPNLVIEASTTGTSGGVSFASTVNGASAGVNNLTINASNGNVNFNNAVGATTSLGTLSINSTGTNTFTGAVRATSLDTDTGGSTVVNGNITTLGNQTFNDNVIIGNGIADITFDADSNSDSIGAFGNLGTINGTGKNISIRSASLNIGGDITADKLTLIPSTPNSTIAIGSSATGDFVISDTIIPFLKANLVAIAVNNNNNVNINTNQPFANGTSLEIGTAASPANSISAFSSFTQNFNINGNLSLAASNIQLGNTTVSGDLTFTNPLTVGQNTGVISVNGLTKFLINNPDTDIILRRSNIFRGGVSFTGSQSLIMRDLELNNTAENSSITDLPTNFRDLILTLENSTINLPKVSLTGRLRLTGRDVIIDQDVVTTEATLNGGNITINRNFTTTDNNLLGLSINSSGTFRISPTSNINVAGEFFDTGTGNNAIAGNITATSVFFNRDVNLVGDTNIVSGSSIRFFGSVNGAFALNLDANGNQISMSQFGDTTPLGSLTIAPKTTITPYSIFSESQSDKDNISINVIGNITLGDLSNDRDSSITISSQGAINIGNINTAATVGNAGNVTVTALQNLTTGNINASAIAGDGGSVKLTSNNGTIKTGDVNTSGNKGGEIFYNARTAINAGRINSSGALSSAGNVTLDPIGDVVVSSIDASSLTQGGNVTLVSTGSNLKITDTIVSSINSSCIGASICTVGGSGGNISLQTGGLSSFVVGDASLNGSRGILTTGLSTLNLGTSIPVLFGSIFTQGGISISPGGFAPIITVTFSSDPTFEPPKKPDRLFVKDPIEEKLLGIRDIAKKEADRYLSEGKLDKAFDALERAYASELEIFTGNSVGNSAITIENTQDLLSTVAQQTGDVAVLIYPVLLNNRIEILVIPPKDKGVPFRRFTLAANQEIVESVVTDYRNNLRDVGSNDYLEQSQKLYDWIIRPIDKELKAMKVNTLVFVMDGGLRVSPPAALHDGKQFLIERFAIANIPSMRVTRVEERDRKATRVLAMGLTESVEGFSALPSVDIEIKTISSEVLKGSFFLNKEFTVSNLQNQRQRGIYNILHLGTHAKFVSDTNKDSFIQFWDSRLRLSQIPKLRFDSPVIDMLTLSACQTAVGNNLGISGLAVESGARSVLASLWEVSDTGTAPLMISFYNAFPEAVNKAQAMQTAQINLLLGKVNVRDAQILGIQGFPTIPLPLGSGEIDLSHPFYWSSFILVGNWL